jgi:hypothetical protein
MSDVTPPPEVPRKVKAYAWALVCGLAVIAAALIAWRGNAILLDLAALAALCF